MRILLLTFIFGLSLLVPQQMWADSLGALYEDEIAQVQQMYSQRSGYDKELIERVLQKTKKAQCYYDFENCYISECDISPQNCRKDYILLFRGEEGAGQAKALSSLVYSKHAGTEYGAGMDALQTLQLLHDDVQTLKCDHQIHDNEIYLYKNSGFPNVWLKSDNRTELTCEHGDSKYLSPLQQIYLSHKMESHLMFRDKKLQHFVKLNPFLGFSSKPDRALEFAGVISGYDTHGMPTHIRESIGGTLLIIAVPKAELRIDCKNGMPLPGQMMRTDKCFDQAEPFAFEDELVATLYPHPRYIYKVFEIPKIEVTSGQFRK